MAGRYQVDRLSLISNNIHMHYERDIDSESETSSDLFRRSHVTVYRPAGCLDCELVATKHIRLDRNNTLDLKLHTGRNAVTSCDIRVRPNTGGLRLLTTDAQFIGPAFDFAHPPEAGLFRFGPLPADTTLQLRFPYSTEQDIATISARAEVTYTTDDGTYSFWVAPSIPISLALGVNVQDIFKHSAVFSRFSVSTASPSPLLLLESELRESEVYQPHFGPAPGKTIMVFPKQPASLLYKIVRKPDVSIHSKTSKTLYLKLHYTVVLDEIVVAAEASLKQAARAMDLAPFANVLATYVRKHLPARLTAYDLERAALLGEFSTIALVGDQHHLAASFAGLGNVPGSEQDASVALASLVQDWHRDNPTLALPLAAAADVEDTPSILIPVDVPSVPVHCTVDIRLEKPLPSPLPYESTSAMPVAGINQLLSANLALQWTRKWHTAAATAAAAAGQENAPSKQEFIYEVTASADTWLLGGQKRGRIVVPAEDASMDIPLLMAPLREGWLPYPSVEIREAKWDEQGGAPGAHGPIEVDYRNLGETVQVVADRERVTLSLDSSGPGGGPLVLESERRVIEGRVVV